MISEVSLEYCFEAEVLWIAAVTGMGGMESIVLEALTRQ